MKKRDVWFDNYKALLIVLVVIGHFLEPLRDKSETINDIYFLIYSFHMPAFIIISGYFSKKKCPLMKEVKGLLVPYLIFQFLHFLLYNLVLGDEAELHIFQPHFTLWYLLCLFIWKFITPYLVRIKYIFWIAVVLGLIIDGDSTMGTFMSLSRGIVYYPFFLIGYYMDKDKLTAFFQNKIWKWIAAAVVVGYALLVFFVIPNDDIYNKFVSCRYCFDDLGLTFYEGTFFIGCFYLVALTLTIAIGILISSKKRWYTYLGSRTMSIYLFHGLVQRFIVGYTGVYERVDSYTDVGQVVIFSIVLTFVLALPFFMKIIKKLSNIKLEKILIDG